MLQYLSLKRFLNSNVYSAWKNVYRLGGIKFLILGIMFIILTILFVYNWLFNLEYLGVMTKYELLPIFILMGFGASFLSIYVAFRKFFVKKPDWVLYGDVEEIKKTGILVKLSDCSKIKVKSYANFDLGQEVLVFGWKDNSSIAYAVKPFIKNKTSQNVKICKQSAFIPVV